MHTFSSYTIPSTLANTYCNFVINSTICTKLCPNLPIMSLWFKKVEGIKRIRQYVRAAQWNYSISNFLARTFTSRLGHYCLKLPENGRVRYDRRKLQPQMNDGYRINLLLQSERSLPPLLGKVKERKADVVDTAGLIEKAPGWKQREGLQ